MNSVELNARDQIARVKLSRADSKRAKKKRDSSSSRSATGEQDRLVDVQQLPAVPVLHQQLSDSSDSNDGNSAKRPFINTAECTVPHEGTEIINVILPVNIDTLFQTLYSDSKFLEDFHESRKIVDIVQTKWKEVTAGADASNDGALRTRTISCKVPLKLTIGPKFSNTTEQMKLMDCSVEGILYSVNRLANNDGIPYGDTFSIKIHQCLVRTIDDHTMFSVNVQVVFLKSLFSLVKNKIEKSTMDGMNNFYIDLLAHLQSHFCSPPAKGKRHSRNSSKASVITLTKDQSPSLGSVMEHLPDRNDGAEMLDKVGKQSKTRAVKSLQRKSIVWFVIAVMCCITALNIGLFVKLMALEGSFDTIQLKTDLLLFASENRSNDEWIELLQRREFEHQQNLDLIKDALATTIDALQQTHKYLSNLVSSMHAPILPDE